jgi:hypothetical protein
MDHIHELQGKVERLEKEKLEGLASGREALDRLEKRREALEKDLALHPKGANAPLHKAQLHHTIEDAEKIRKSMAHLEQTKDKEIKKQRGLIQNSEDLLTITEVDVDIELGERRKQAKFQGHGGDGDFVKDQTKILEEHLKNAKEDLERDKNAVDQQKAKVDKLKETVVTSQDKVDTLNKQLTEKRQELHDVREQNSTHKKTHSKEHSSGEQHVKPNTVRHSVQAPSRETHSHTSVGHQQGVDQSGASSTRTTSTRHHFHSSSKNDLGSSSSEKIELGKLTGDEHCVDVDKDKNLSKGKTREFVTHKGSPPDGSKTHLKSSVGTHRSPK